MTATKPRGPQPRRGPLQFTFAIRPWRLLAAGIVYVVANRIINSASANWGAQPQEITASFPSDGLVARPRWRTTKAVTINAPPGAVWPWLAQIGQGRAGWYSNDTVLNALNSTKVTSATRIHPEWQDVKVGDDIDATDHIFLKVAKVEPGVVLAMASDGRNMLSQPWETCWSFWLKPVGKNSTRLLLRDDSDWTSWAVGQLVRRTDAAKSYLMRACLMGVKQRAEDSVRASAGQDAGQGATA